MKTRNIIIASEQELVNEIGLKIGEFFEQNPGRAVISAIDFGYDVRAFGFNTPELPVFFNPRIVFEDPEEVVMDEHFTEKPGLFMKIRRPKSVKMRAVAHDGQGMTQFFTGVTARAAQHEIDRLDDVDIAKLANAYHREQGYKKYKKYLRNIG